MSTLPRVPLLGVLAGGASSRFPAPGGKLAADLGGEPMLAYLVARLLPQAHELVLAGRPPPGLWVPPGLRVLEDPPGLSGPLAGLVALARAAPEGFVVVAGDVPFLPPGLAGALWEAGVGAAAAALAGPEPLPLALRPEAYPVLEELARAGRGPRHLLRRLDELELGLRALPPPPPDELADVDTPADLRVAREHLARRACGPVEDAEPSPASGVSAPLLRWDS